LYKVHVDGSIASNESCVLAHSHTSRTRTVASEVQRPQQASLPGSDREPCPGYAIAIATDDGSRQHAVPELTYNVVLKATVVCKP